MFEKSTNPTFRELGAIQYDQHNSRIGFDRLSIMILQSRLGPVTRIGECQRARFDRGLIYYIEMCILSDCSN